MNLKDYRYDGTHPLKLSGLPTSAPEEARAEKATLVKQTESNIARAAELQERLYAAGEEALVIALQARDAAGKDSLIKKVFSGLNPAALEVHSFKAPTATELRHDYLWRMNAALPPRGKIALFNRSQYEDVLAVRVHHLEKTYRLAPRCLEGDFFPRRYRQLKHWESYLYENGIRMVKVFLNVSEQEQRDRFLDRISLEEKHWKLSTADMKERALWDEYDAAYEDCINATATPESPWYVLPADAKWFTRYLMSEILVRTLEDMNPQFPPLPPEEIALLPQVMAALDIE